MDSLSIQRNRKMAGSVPSQSAQDARNTQSQDRGSDRGRPDAWKVVSVVLAIALATTLTLWLATSVTPASQTVTKWSRYETNSGVDNVTAIFPGTFCAPSGATSVPIFSMLWDTSNGQSAENVRLWTLYPPTPSHPLGQIVNLYSADNASHGGTSFESTYPAPCSYDWYIAVNASAPLAVSSLVTLTYNYTSIPALGF